MSIDSPRWIFFSLAGPMDDAAWNAARARMLLQPGVLNLNTGSFGPLSIPVFERVTDLRRQLAAEPMDFLVRQVPALLWQARQRLATFLGAEPERLIFTNNVTHSVNLIASALTLAAPGEILLTDHEYGAMHWCWERAAQRLGLTLRTFPMPLLPADPHELVAAVCAALSERTRLLFFSHILSPTGMILPARAICAEARRRGVLTVVDGAHAPGMIPLDLQNLGCDFYGANCHKWMLAPTGSGFLYLGKGNEDRLQPLQVSWGWHYDRSRADERDDHGSTHRLRALEFEGTRDPCAWLAVPAAIDFLEDVGFEAIRARMVELAAYVRQRLSPIPELRLSTPALPGLHGSLTAYRLPQTMNHSALQKDLWAKHRIEVNIFGRAEGPLLRISTHFYNSRDEVDALAAALPALLAAHRS